MLNVMFSLEYEENYLLGCDAVNTKVNYLLTANQWTLS
jgi:hypothetical protein